MYEWRVKGKFFPHITTSRVEGRQAKKSLQQGQITGLPFNKNVQRSAYLQARAGPEAIGTVLAQEYAGKVQFKISRRFVMKNFLMRLAAALVFVTGLMALSAQTSQQADNGSSRYSATPQQAGQQQNDMQTQEAKPFNGTIVKEKGKLVLKDTAANISYQLDDQDKAKQFEGKQVKVTGKLDMNTNLIHVDSIEGGS
jgi:hypothetical protein